MGVGRSGNWLNSSECSDMLLINGYIQQIAL